MLLLQKYTITKTLGRGPYGKVFLAQSQGKQYAIKQISKQALSDDPEHQQYIQQETHCMINVKSDYLMKILDKKQDSQNIYFICEYCHGGNLINYQSKLQNCVFPLDKAILALSHVIKGLLQLHSYQFLYKDIKPQNILIEINADKTETFKLADFGFERNKNVNIKTKMVIGTLNYMAPERFQEEQNEQQIDETNQGFGIDIWAVGVTLFWMLNMDYPFQLKAKNKQNINIIKNTCTPSFNYKQAVLKTNKKLINTATPDVMDLFQKIFKINPKQRISFHNIKQHKLFKQHFTNKQMLNRSFLIYQDNFELKIKSKIIQNKSIIQEKNKSKLNATKNIMTTTATLLNKTNKFQMPKESVFIGHKNTIKSKNFTKIEQQQEPDELESEIKKQKVYQQQRYLSTINSKIESGDFEEQLQQFGFQKQKNQLLLSISELFLQEKHLDLSVKYSLRYYTLKLFIIYWRNLKNKCDKKVIPSDSINKLNWNGFFKSQAFKQISNQVTEKLKQEEMKFQIFYSECKSKLETIQSSIKNFKNGFKREIVQIDFEGDFKHLYRTTTSRSYGIIANILKHENQMTKEQIQKLYFILINIFICHCFNRIFTKSDLSEVFNYYFKWKYQKNFMKKSNSKFDFTSFKEWLTVQNRQNLKKTTEIIIKKYFGVSL